MSVISQLKRRFRRPLTLPPLQTMLSLLIAMLLLNSAMIYFMGRQPHLGLTLVVQNDALVLARDVFTDYGSLSKGQEVRSIEAAGVSLALDASDLVDEPDLFSGYDGYNRFMERQSILYRLLQEPRVTISTGNGQRLSIAPVSTPWSELPAMFWLQLLVADISLLAGMAVWLFRQGDGAAKQYCLTGVFLAVVIYPAAIYSSRELAIAGEVFRYLSVTDHFGLYMVMAAITSLIWSYPNPISRFPFTRVMYGLMFACWVADTAQWFPSLDVSTRLIAVAVLLLGILLLVAHWRRSDGNASYRISIKWFLLVIVVGCGLFVAVVFVPPLLGEHPLVSQGLAFVAFLSIYISLAIGVVRYQLFELDRWWFEVWVWVAVGILMAGFDILFISLLKLSPSNSLWLALVIAGWAYFPVRQWLMRKLLSSGRHTLDNYLPMVVRTIAGAGTVEELSAGCRHCLINIYAPMAHKMERELDTHVSIGNNGLCLRVPFLYDARTLILEYPENGHRLFQPQDRDTTEALVNLFQQALEARSAREDGVRSERERVKQDIHDSLGGRLLSIMHQKDEPESAAVATAAWRELRDILSALEGKKAPLMLIVDQWHKDIRQQADKAGVPLQWLIEEPLRHADIVLSGRQRLNLGQVLREAVTNALRHSRATGVTVSFSGDAQRLGISVENDGCDAPPGQWLAGRGLHHMQSRAGKLSAEIAWSDAPGGVVRVAVWLPVVENADG